jgi:hypothetical protein
MGAMPRKNALNFYHDWLEPLKKISEKDFKKFFLAMMEYDMYGTPPPEFQGSAGMAAAFIFPQLERARKYSEAQKKGGYDEASKGTPKVDQRYTKGTPKVEQRYSKGQVYNTYTQTETITNTFKENEKESGTVGYGEYGNVFLTDGDLEKLKREFPGDYQERIDKLSRYMESSGKRYRNHLATIRNWARREEAAQPQADNKGSFETDSFYEAAVRHSLGDN